MESPNKIDILIKEGADNSIASRVEVASNCSMFGGVGSQNSSLSLMAGQLDYIAKMMSKGKGYRNNFPVDCSSLESGYTYLGQMVAHDLTPSTSKLENFSSPIGRSEVKMELGLNCVYPEDGQALNDYLLGQFKGSSNIFSNMINATNGQFILRRVNARAYDLPRSESQGSCGVPFIPDIRNDENVIISQLHVIWLRLHNKLISKHSINSAYSVQENFIRTKKIVVLLFQYIVVNDLLKKIMHQSFFDYYFPPSKNITTRLRWCADEYVPMEFSHAAFRFPHTMVRQSYNLTLDSSGIDIIDLVRAKRPLEQKHIIDWRVFFKGASSSAISAVKMNTVSALDLNYPGGFNENKLINNLKTKYRRAYEEFLDNLTNLLKSILSFLNIEIMSFKEASKSLIKNDLRASVKVLNAKEILCTGLCGLPHDLKKLIEDAFNRVCFRTSRLSKATINYDDKKVQLDKNNAPLILYLLREGALDNDVACHTAGPLASLVIGEVIERSINRVNLNFFSCDQQLQEELGQDYYDDYIRVKNSLGNNNLMGTLINKFGLANET